MLINLVEGISSWAELEARIASLPLENERGNAFEEFCKAFFLLNPVFQFEKVYRQHEIPPSVRKRLSYPGIQDIGIDGIGITIDGRLIAYQAKFRSDRNNTPTLKELATFFTVSDKADWRITITNSNSLPPATNERINSSRVLADKFDQIDSEFFERLRFYLKEQQIKPQRKKVPHQFQEEVIDTALSFFQEHNRGQLILPCGTGKTLVAMWIAEKLGGKRILVMVPSLSLLSQSLREWAVNTSIKPFRYLCLCSDTTVDLGKDSPIEHLYEMDIPVTTDVNVLIDFLIKEPSLTSVLFSTYQSSKVLTEASKNTGIYFDTAIFDEAHRTTGSDVGVWNMALDNKNISIKKRIFMTATARIYAPHILKKAKEKDILLYSMDDYTVYGSSFYEMTFGQAIEKTLITDYKIIIISVTDREISELIQQGVKIIIDDSLEWNARVFAKQVALVKALDAYNLKKVFTFHSSVPNAKEFTLTDSPNSIRQVIKIVSSSNKEKNIKLFHVNGTMSSGIRNSIIKEFRESEISIMSNARCLIEGVDVPAVDTVAFIDPKKSIIDIVQATGRALRKAEWKEKGYIFIPVVVDDDAKPEDLIKSSDFDTVWQVLQTMMDQDQRLQSIISQLRTMQGAGKEYSQEWNNIMTKYQEKVEFYNLPKKMKHTHFTEKLYTKIIEITARSWDFWYGLTIRYKMAFGDANVPPGYKTHEGYALGYWQVHQRRLYKKAKLNSERINKLKELGFILSPLEDAFERGFKETCKYKEEFGNANAPKRYKTSDGSNLGSWQIQQRQNYKKGLLAYEKVRRFEEIGFKWKLRFSQVAETKHTETTHDEDQESGYNVEHTETTHRRSFDVKYFNDGFLQTLIYKEIYGTANTPFNYITPSGSKLGAWQNTLRERYEKGELPWESIKKLEEIGFKWELENKND